MFVFLNNLYHFAVFYNYLGSCIAFNTSIPNITCYL